MTRLHNSRILYQAQAGKNKNSQMRLIQFSKLLKDSEKRKTEKVKRSRVRDATIAEKVLLGKDMVKSQNNSVEFHEIHEFRSQKNSSVFEQGKNVQTPHQKNEERENIADKVDETKSHGAVSQINFAQVRQVKTRIGKLDHVGGYYTILNKINSGLEGTVYSAIDTFRELQDPIYRIAIKMFNTRNSCIKNIQGYERELRNYLRNPNHQNILKGFNHGAEPFFEEGEEPQDAQKVPYIVLELCHEMNLCDLIEKKTFNESDAKALMIKIWSGLAALNKYGISHLDIKPANILVGRNDNDIKIADFGHSIQCCNMHEWVNFPSPAGTPGYCPAEMEEGRLCLPSQVDIYSLGVTLFCIIIGVMPFLDGDRNEDKLYQCLQQNPEFFWEWHLKHNPKDISPYFKNLVTSMLQHDPTHRPTLQQISQDVWFRMEPQPATEEQLQISIRDRMRMRQ